MDRVRDAMGDDDERPVRRRKGAASAPAEIKAARGIVAPIPLIAKYNDQWQSSFESAIK